MIDSFRSRIPWLIGASIVLVACSNAEPARDEAIRTNADSAVADSRATTSNACTAPDTALGGQGLKVVPRDIAGRYQLTVVASGGEGTSSVTGELVLDTTSEVPRSASSVVSYPLGGSSTVDLTKLGPVTLAHSPATSIKGRPGVQARYDSLAATLRLVFGNSKSVRGVQRDAGVYFDVLELSPDGFRGRWTDGGRTSAAPAGYFCATRV